MISALLFFLFLVFMLARIPVAMAITLACLISMIVGDYELRTIPQVMAKATQSVPLMAVPFFILAANLMNVLGITQRIFDFAASIVGFIRGGLAHVNVVASMIFAGISGAAVADAAGLGTIEMRAMREAGYDLGFSASVTIASSTIGPIIPPSISMVIYALTAKVSIAHMFVAGIIPGILIGAILMALIYVRVRFGRQDCPPPIAFSWKRVRDTARDGLLSLLAPVIILWGMVGGVVTPTEAGVLAIAYSLVIGAVYRSYKFSELPKILRETVETSALVLYIVAVSSVLSWVLLTQGTAHALAAWLPTVTTNPLLYLLFINVPPDRRGMHHRNPAGDANHRAHPAADRPGAGDRSRALRHRRHLQPADRYHHPPHGHRPLHPGRRFRNQVRRLGAGQRALPHHPLGDPPPHHLHTGTQPFPSRSPF